VSGGHRRGRELLRALEADGWRLERVTGSGHYLLTHPEASAPLVMAATPGGGRADRNTRAMARRLLGGDAGG
jgi:hypothetical protein